MQTAEHAEAAEKDAPWSLRSQRLNVPQGWTLLYGVQRDVEQQRRVGRNRRAAAVAAVGEVGRNDEAAPSAHAHARDAPVPSLDHLSAAERKGEARVRVELGALPGGLAGVVEPPGVRDRHGVARRGGGAAAEGEVGL